jgi:hypothetical protein
MIVMGWIFYPIAEKYSQSFKFVDENEHMVMAWLMTKGYRLYEDFPNNHQPINYFLSYLIQQVFTIDNVFMLVKRHREFIFAWSLFWWVILVKRFKAAVILPIFLFESVKYFTLGNEFLAEALVCYPLAYLMGDLMGIKPKTEASRSGFWAGLLTGLVQFTLLPMAPVLGWLTVMRFIRLKGRGWGMFALGFGVIALMVFAFVPIKDYITEVLNALVYSLPGLRPVTSNWDWWRIPLLPFLYLPYFRDPIGQVVLLASFWWLAAMGFLVRKGQKRSGLLVFGLWLAWLFTNTRDAHADRYFYQGFHLTPWLLVGLTGGMLALVNSWQYIWAKTAKRLIVGQVIFLGVFLANQDLPLYTKIDPLTEHYVQYTPLSQAAEKINNLKQPGDRLMVIPNQSLIYYMTDLEPAETNMFTFYDWQLDVPKNKQGFYDTLENNPPAFIVYDDDGSSYGPFVNELVKYQYRKLNEYPHTYIRSDLESRLQ